MPKIANLDYKLSPEGFNELFEYFRELPPNQNVEVKEIQTALHNKYNFSSGKVTGIIKRATEKDMLEQVQRGIYKFNENFMAASSSHSLITSTNALISAVIKDINALSGEKFNEMTEIDFQKVKKKIEKLNEALSL